MSALLTEREVADRLRVSVATVRAERARGRLAFVRVGGRAVRVTEEQVNQYIRGRTCASENSGSPSVAVARSGALPGSTSGRGRLSDDLLALEILQRPKRPLLATTSHTVG